MPLEDIGFYTLSDARARQASMYSPMWRGEILLTQACNFSCLYCRKVGPAKMAPAQAIIEAIDLWCDDGLKNIRFSGGEPTLYPHLLTLVKYCHDRKIERIALSTNGSAPLDLYIALMDCGVNDFSISLDACCAATAQMMAGGVDAFDIVTRNIGELSKRTYTTIGIVLTPSNLGELSGTVRLAHELGATDIRLIPGAQYGDIALRSALLASLSHIETHRPILWYRLNNLRNGIPLRGLRPQDADRCFLIQDDAAISEDLHYPCIIYLREGGDAIGMIGLQMRRDRVRWMEKHHTLADPICRKNCLDVCRDYNNVVARSRDNAS